MNEAESRELSFVALTGVLGVALLSLILSVHESRLNQDVFHWGLMYASAYDLLLGRVPYRETYEIYGIVTSGAFALAMLLWGKSIFVIGNATGAFYAISLVLTFFIWQRFIGPILAFLAVVAMFCAHSHVSYPWANYLAYVFLLSSVLLLTGPGRPSARTMMAAGAFSALSILARQSFAPIVLAAICFHLLTLSRLGWRTAQQLGVAYVIGFGVVLAPFAIYLLGLGLVGDFKTLSVSVARVLLGAIEREGNIQGLGAFLKNLLGNLVLNRQHLGEQPGDARTLAFSVATLAAVLTLAWWAIGSIRQRRRGWAEPPLPHGDRVALLAVVSLCGLSQALHIFDVFRLAAASGIGLGLPFYLVGSLLPGRHRVALVLSAVATCGLALFALPLERMSSAPPLRVYNGNIEVMRSKEWPEERTLPYERISAALETARNCGLTDLINLSVDPLIPYLVPTLRKSQREPSRASWHESDKLFPDEVARRDALLRAEVAALVLPLGAEVPPAAATYAEVFEEGHVRLVDDRGFRVLVPDRCRGAFPGQRELRSSLEHYRSGQFQDAVADAGLALAAYPNLADAYNTLAVSYGNLRMFDQGIHAAQEAIRLRPDLQLARNNLAWLEEQRMLASASASK